MYQIIVDGIAWVDSDGNDAWPQIQADALADHLTSMGYQDVQVVTTDWCSPSCRYGPQP